MSSPYVVAFIWALLTSSDWLNFHFDTSMPLVKREPRTNPQDPVQRILKSGHSDIDVVGRISVKGCVAGCPTGGRRVASLDHDDRPTVGQPAWRDYSSGAQSNLRGGALNASREGTCSFHFPAFCLRLPRKAGEGRGIPSTRRRRLAARMFSVAVKSR
ncbi:hypothetical protein BN2476_1010020 [Paraburkholderia piptadeniae]|uniref:Uncharacterized protein n=1 Tax=Paraburkholderia piptadeniae TaxID=1701573 RepID=A0A1N7SUP1_9BURK|nr:hypothetical protein BN2476_1010020 [Paraburkholderia piptadeniae]